MKYNPEAPFDEEEDPPSFDGMGGKTCGGVTISFILFVLIAIILVTLSLYAFGHDYKQPNLNQWYAGLTNDNGVSCCDATEATRIANVDWQSACIEGKCHYQVFISNKWWDVPDWAVLKGPNLDGEALVWPIYYWRDGKPENGLYDVFIRCFMPGAGG